MEEYRFLLIIAVLSAISILITYGLGRLFRQTAFVKFIPAILALLGVIWFFIKASTPNSGGFEDLAYFLMAMLFMIAFVASLITAIIMEVVYRKRARRQS